LQRKLVLAEVSKRLVHLDGNAASHAIYTGGDVGERVDRSAE
jgi:hypothetical protein